MVVPIPPKERLSAVTIAIKKVQKDSLEAHESSILTADHQFDISIANSRKSRQQAFQLGYEVYRTKRYIPENKSKMLITPYDFHASTCIINIHSQGEMIASITLNFREKSPLPCEELYSTELLPFLQKDTKLVELTRLAIKEKCRQSSNLLAQLFQSAHIYAFLIKKIKNLVIEVNPRHVTFYQRLLNFSIIGEKKSCERVGGAPAVLLHLDLQNIQENLTKFYNKTLEQERHLKFFKLAMSSEKSKAILQKFEQTYQSISFAEKIYFKLQSSSSNELLGAITC